jgi:hypothetical protein
MHLEYVGHADVTLRLLEVDPEWKWEPKATDVDPEVMKAAVASGDAEVVRMVIGNAPPRFERDRNGFPVGLWIRLTVGGSTKLGYGSCPATQADAEKVLIGDALRNAAMRFGVATSLWAKGDRADPAAENATAASGQAQRGRPARQESPQEDRVTRLATTDDKWLDEAIARAANLPNAIECRKLWKESADKVRAGTVAKEDAKRVQDILKARIEGLGREAKLRATALDPEDEWAVKVDALISMEEADGALAEAGRLFNAGHIDARRRSALDAAISARFPGAGDVSERAAA